MTETQNRTISVVMVFVTYLFSVAIPNITDVITLTGATINPFIGFIFPILFYLKLDPKPYCSLQKIFAFVVMILIMISSILGLYNYFSPKQ